MTEPPIELAYPLVWPDGRPRSSDRKAALFRHEGRSLVWTTALRRLRDDVGAMTRPGRPWRTTELVLSTNIRFTASGARDKNVSRHEPVDPGVAFYFALDRRPHVLACDKWDTVYDNVAAIAAHIDALRGQERWGVADLAQAFAGHVALPSIDPWWVVLGVARDADLGTARAAYRARAKTAHPNAGGQRAEWDRLQAAIDAAERSAK